MVIVLALATVLQLQSIFAENRMQLKKGSDNSITIELTNANAIEGVQFSIQGRGGIAWGSYEGSERTTAAGLAIYQYLANDSTLNVVILAPVRLPLPSGQGIIGRVGFALRQGLGTDTVSVFLSRLVICDAEAKYLDVSAAILTWNRQESNEARLATFTLEQNYPNPFNPSTTIAYKLSKPAEVRLVIYDITGRKVRTLVSQQQPKGQYSVKWNAVDDEGAVLSSGMYIARLKVSDEVATKKLLLMK